MSLESRCYGCILGAWIGDASGAVLEFKGIPSASSLQSSLSLPGGGVHKVGPGQITDDGELTCSLMQGLIKGNGSLNLNKIAESYSEWFLSKPFDIGNTLRKSIPKACKMKIHQAELMRRGSKLAESSQSNGCLMKISPLIVWCRNLNPEEIFRAVWEEVGLTHSNSTVRIACAFFVIVGVGLINGESRQNSYLRTKDFMGDKINQEVREWILEIEKDDCDVPVNKPAGWAKIAFIYSMRYLLQGKSYIQAISEIMSHGGDTDTNACIIGSLIGAAEGTEGIPPEMIEKVKTWTPKKGGLKRPKFLQVNHNFGLISSLIAISPNTLTIIGASSEYSVKN